MPWPLQLDVSPLDKLKRHNHDFPLLTIDNPKGQVLAKSKATLKVRIEDPSSASGSHLVECQAELAPSHAFEGQADGRCSRCVACSFDRMALVPSRRTAGAVDVRPVSTSFFLT